MRELALGSIQRFRQSAALKAGATYTAAIFAQRLISFIGLPLVAAFLTPDEFGTVAIFASWMTIFSTILTLNVNAAVTNAQFDFEGERFQQFKSSILFLGLPGCALALLIFGVMPDAWLDSVFDMPRSMVLAAVIVTALYLPIQVMLDAWRAGNFYQAFSALSLLLSTYVLLLSLLLILILPVIVPDINRAWGRIDAMLILYAAVGGVFLLRQFLRTPTFYNREFWRYTLVIALPLIPHLLSGIVLQRFDQLMIDAYIGRAETGIYSLAYRFGEITNMLWTATNSAWVVWFYARMSENNTAHIRRRAHQYLIAFAGASVLLMLAGPVMVLLLTGEAYHGAAGVVPPVMTAGFFTLLYSFYANVEFYEKKTGFIALGTVIASVVNVVLNMLLLPRYGYAIAAWTTLVSYICLYLMHAAIVIFRLRQRLFNFTLLNLFGLGMVVLAIIITLVTNALT